MTCEFTEFPSKLGWRRVDPCSYMCSYEKGLATLVYKESKVGKAKIQDKISSSQNTRHLHYLNPFHCSFERVLKGSREYVELC